MFKRLALAAAAACLFVVGAFDLAALADTATTVTVPVGNWVADVLAAAQPTIVVLLMGVVAWVMAKLPSGIQAIVVPLLTEQLFQRAADFAHNAVAGAAKDKALTVDVGNAVVATGVRYVVEHGPAWLIALLKSDGALAIEQKMIARLNLGAGAMVLPGTARIIATPAAVPASPVK